MHFISVLYEVLDDMQVLVFTIFKTWTIMQDKSIIVVSKNFGIYVGFAWVDM